MAGKDKLKSARKNKKPSAATSASNPTDKRKTKDQLIEELVKLRRKTKRLENTVKASKKAKSGFLDDINIAEIVTDNIGAGLCIISRDYKTVWANDVIKNIFGETVGKTCYKAYNKQDNICPWCAVRKVFEHGGKDKVITEAEGEDKDGNTVWSKIIATPIYDKDGNIEAAFELVVPITELKQAQKDLQTAYDKLDEKVVERTEEISNIFSLSMDLVCIANMTHFLKVSPSCKEILGYNEEEIRDIPFLELIHPDDVRPTSDYIEEKLKQGIPAIGFVNRYRHKDGSYRWLEWMTKPVPEKGLLYAVARDITERKNAEKAIQESEEKYREFIESTDDLVTQVDNQGNFLLLNHKSWEVLGLPPEDCLGKSAFSFIHPDDRERTQQWFQDMSDRKEKTGSMENRQVSVDKKVSHMLWTTNFHYNNDGSVSHVNSIASDISELKKTEEDLRQALSDKDFLITEINHRVKNNLAILHSLVSVQLKSVDDEVVKGHLQSVTNRILAIGVIHDQLHMTSDVHNIDVKDYINSLTSQVYHSLVIDPEAVTLRVEVSEVSLKSDHIIPCGLILNELLTNSLKYAFTPDKKGTVHVVFKEETPGQYRLTVKDNGVGLPKDFTMGKAGSLGLKLVDALVQQLEGTLDYKSDRGTEFIITFKA